jgi:RNA polymerase sigma-70 factor (ECF subfamily)
MAAVTFGAWFRPQRRLAFALSDGIAHLRLPSSASGLPRPGAYRVSGIQDRALRWIGEAPSDIRGLRGDNIMDMQSEEPALKTLMLAGLDGDAAAHKALLTRLSVRLRAYFRGQLARIGKAPTDAEDLLQETLIALHTRRHTYDRSQLLTPWVYAIARYRLVDYLRRTKASTRDVPVEEAAELSADDDATAVESRLDLQKLMAQLAPKTRCAIQMVKLDGLSVREAAKRSGMSESAIKVSVHRGLRTLSLLVSKEAVHED